jgi:biotin carboxylase
MDHHLELARRLVEGRRVVVATDVVVTSAALAARLEDDLGTRGSSMMEGIRAFEAALDDPPALLRDAIDRFDPDGEAVVIGTLFSQRAELCGRPLLGARAPGWMALEDKTTVDAVWDAAGVPRAPSMVVDLDEPVLRGAVEAMDAGQGTVWAADTRDGWHGGASGVRWIRPGDDLAAARDELAQQADRVRVMPFLDGVPCSIHGWVLGGDVIALRPCEMLVLRVPGSRSFRYAGAATSWLPAEQDTEAMRAVASRVGTHLRDTLGYRGVFTVDGVLTVEGFRPTELNPRFGAAIGMLGRGAGLPLYLLHLASIEHPAWDWRPAELEAGLLEASRAHVVGSGHTLLELAVDEPRPPLRLARDASGSVTAVPVPAPEPDAAAPDDGFATAELGPAPAGALLRVVLDDPPVGPHLAPRVAEALTAAAAAFDVAFPPVEPAPDLRPR